MLIGLINLLAAIFIVLYLFSLLPAFLIMAFILYGIIGFSRFWVSRGKTLKVVVECKEKAVFQKQEAHFSLIVSNPTSFSFASLKVTFHVPVTFKIEGLEPFDTYGLYHLYRVLVSIGPKEELRRELKIIPYKRGSFLIGDVILHFEDPFSLIQNERHLAEWKEIVVYPEVESIPHTTEMTYHMQGDLVVKRWFLDDPSYPRGSREYRIGDPLQRIDWKATGRLGQLYTKQFDYTAESHLVIIGNLSSGEKHWMNTNDELIEKVIRTIASTAYLLTVRGSRFHLLFNVKLAGSNDYWQLQAGHGQNHLVRVLYQLAKLRSYRTTPIPPVLDKVMEQYPMGATILFVTAVLTEELELSLMRMRQKGYSIQLCLVQKDGSPIRTPFSKRGSRVG